MALTSHPKELSQAENNAGKAPTFIADLQQNPHQALRYLLIS
tara:strand:- start:15378 stop:15503 length:126 start_codon:yes stop_codon:yes gene_type:complete